MTRTQITIVALPFLLLSQPALAGSSLQASSFAQANGQDDHQSDYQALQSQTENENRSYTAISNIMKAKHDTVKNSISNIR